MYLDGMAELQRLAAERAAIDAAIAREVRAMRAAGFSWSAIGAELGISKQAAQQRYGDAGAR